MANFLKGNGPGLAPKHGAPQHRPRPLTLFLDLVRRETGGQPERLARVLAGLRAYQEAPRPPVQPPKPALAVRRGAALRDHGGSGPPLLFVPSLINPPDVLDLAPGKSLTGWLATQGFRVLLLDWGDVEERRDLGVAAHVEEILLPLIEELGEPPLLAGYCLGGTMAIGAAAAAKTKGLALLAAPWRFAGFPDESRRLLAELWRGAEPAAASFGMLPMEVLQSAFWSLDPARTVAKFERLASLPPQAAELQPFVALEDWANDGPPLPEAAAKELFRSLFERDDPGAGRWTVAGRAVRPERLACPVLNIVSRTDRIVPAASAAAVGERLDLDLGHVGMVVGSRAKEALWQPLAQWLSKAAASG